MKKVLGIFIFSLLVTFSSQAQFKIGANIGLPIGDLSDAYSLSWGIDTYYMLGDPNAFLKFGVNASFLNFIGDNTEILGQPVEFENAQFLPLAGAARITLIDIITFGPDIGYAVGLGDNNDGAFYWRLVAGLDLANSVELNAFLQSIAQETSVGALGVGILFEF